MHDPDMKIVADTMREMQQQIEQLTGARHSMYDGAIAIARDRASSPVTLKEALGMVADFARRNDIPEPDNHQCSELEIRAFDAANAEWSTADYQQLVRDLWRACCDGSEVEQGDPPADQVQRWAKSLFENNTFYNHDHEDSASWDEMAAPDGGIRDLHTDMALAAKAVWDAESLPENYDRNFTDA